MTSDSSSKFAAVSSRFKLVAGRRKLGSLIGHIIAHICCEKIAHQFKQKQSLLGVQTNHRVPFSVTLGDDLHSFACSAVTRLKSSSIKICMR